jgi:hypothetical protein
MFNKKGEVEIFGVNGKRFYFKYHQAIDPPKSGKIFTKELKPNAGWLVKDLIKRVG